MGETVFEVTITGKKDAEWQGVVRAGGAEFPFLSLPELLRVLEALLGMRDTLPQENGSEQQRREKR
jgi:hypothetical protein